MNSNEGRPAAQGTQEDYEATVLDFLDREMATVQQAQSSNQQSEELDALVADMLKQVITETDQTQSIDKPLFDEDALFAGLFPESQKPADVSGDPSQYSVPATPSAMKEIVLPAAQSTEESEPLPQTAATHSATAAIFASSTVAASRKFPVKAVAAFAGLAIIIGAAAYFFSGKSGKVTESRPPAVQVAKSAIPGVPAQNQPVAATPGATQENSAVANRSHAAPAVKSSPVVPEKATVQQPTAKSPAAVTKHEPMPAKATDEEKIPAAQPVSAAPTPAPSVEKPTSQPVAETSSPIIPERKPASSQQVATLVNEPPLPAPAPASAGPATSTNLTPAVPMSQASPVYPELALRARASGQVVMELQIDDQGKVVKAAAVSGPAIFYSAAVTAAMKWRYKPASINGVNVASQSRVTMSFNLKK
jgi:TonB family protein